MKVIVKAGIFGLVIISICFSVSAKFTEDHPGNLPPSVYLMKIDKCDYRSSWWRKLFGIPKKFDGAVLSAWLYEKSLPDEQFLISFYKNYKIPFDKLKIDIRAANAKMPYKYTTPIVLMTSNMKICKELTGRFVRARVTTTLCDTRGRLPCDAVVPNTDLAWIINGELFLLSESDVKNNGTGKSLGVYGRP